MNPRLLPQGALLGAGVGALVFSHLAWADVLGFADEGDNLILSESLWWGGAGLVTVGGVLIGRALGYEEGME